MKEPDANVAKMPGQREEDWWDYCPVCGAKLENHKCRFVCSNSRCHFFMSCSEFDM